MRTSAKSSEAKNTLEATLEALPDAVVLLDASGQVQSMNRAAVNALASAGIYEPRRLKDLRLDGLDVSAVTMAIATGAGMATCGINSNHTRGTRGRRSAIAATCRARAGVDSATRGGCSPVV